MVTLEKYEKIHSSGLLLDHYYVLLAIKEGKILPTSRRVKGFLNLLEKKGYILEGLLTEKCDDVIEVTHTTSTTQTTTKAPTQEDVKFAKWVADLHVKCQNKMIQLTGTKQIRGKIENKSYPFLPNSVDLGRVLIRFMNAYKISDYQKIENTILAYIGRCSAAKNWFPLLQYYILKGNQSQMATDMEDVKEESQDDTVVNI